MSTGAGRGRICARMQHPRTRVVCKTILRALRSYEDELISSIQRAESLLPLTKKANEAGLIPQEVNDSLQSMDPNVDHQLKCRYLMLYVYKTLAKFEKWLELLSRHGIDSSVLVRVRRDCVTLHDDARMKATSTSPDEISDDFTFSGCHISILTEVLADCRGGSTMVRLSSNEPPFVALRTLPHLPASSPDQ